MNYCDNCARLLDDEIEICPYCGKNLKNNDIKAAEASEIVLPVVNEQPSGAAITEVSKDTSYETPNVEEPAPSDFNAKLDELNNLLKKSELESRKTVIMNSETSAPSATETVSEIKVEPVVAPPVIDIPKVTPPPTISVSPVDSFGALNNTQNIAVSKSKRSYKSVDGDDEVFSDIKRALFFLLAIALPPAGIIIGLILMSNDTYKFREIGKNIMLIGLVSIIWAVTSCACTYIFLVFGIGMSNFLTNTLILIQTLVI